MNDLTKEQRAHDIAIQLVQYSLDKKESNFHDKVEIFEIIKYYETAYQDALNSFEVEF